MFGKKRFWFIFPLVLVSSGIFISGAYFGYSQRPAVEKVKILFNKETQKPAEVDFSPFWQAWNLLEEKYVDKEELNSQEMLWGAISGLAGSLKDPYTVFFPPEEKKIFESEVKGNFEGVGMEIGMRNNALTVIAPLKNTPAYRAGLKAGDKILKINDTLTSNLTVEEAIRLIRGPKGTEVKLLISREDEKEPMEIAVIREVINIPTLETEIKPGNIFVIKLYNFSENSPLVFRNALREMIESKSDKLVIDLRNNPGGYLEAAVDMASWFLPMGKVVAREKFASGEEEFYRSRGYDVFGDNFRMAILINQGSASASEILAGALKEYGRAVLVGEKTFGKGSVQELVPVTDSTSLKITIASWLTPNGQSISKEGLEPDFEVKFSKEDSEAGRDPQMEKATQFLLD
ncbi:MAG: Carboxyl-terminal protease [Parcubacteria group bacterium GW2011_GWB1_41_6]|nr:MAG: Carboxyl-terminal protease [Parcubacteria group bacterium GW2011_GWB1_41_6]KKS33999.1 MAG: Carboxyl-terminal protease [Parcubacteria group bacterium GW2011_GWC2_42_13]KKS57711.1 MAG: Carboxyl-terminal protease [Parcubacteria group bacterium GW2011_GWA2_42_35]KKS70725.1 MAG: Carboxyl-terminal protease [Parcubacteria group bacterium GW2011_GWF2_42_7]